MLDKGLIGCNQNLSQQTLISIFDVKLFPVGDNFEEKVSY